MYSRLHRTPPRRNGRLLPEARPNIRLRALSGRIGRSASWSALRPSQTVGPDGSRQKKKPQGCLPVILAQASPERDPWRSSPPGAESAFGQGRIVVDVRFGEAGGARICPRRADSGQRRGGPPYPARQPHRGSPALDPLPICARTRADPSPCPPPARGGGRVEGMDGPERRVLKKGLAIPGSSPGRRGYARCGPSGMIRPEIIRLWKPAVSRRRRFSQPRPAARPVRRRAGGAACACGGGRGSARPRSGAGCRARAGGCRSARRRRSPRSGRVHDRSTRSQKYRTTEMSCEMNRKLRPSRARSSSSRSRIWLRIETSRAEVASSAMMMRGSSAKRAGDADALALAAGEGVRVPLHRLRVEPDQAISPRDLRLQRLALRQAVDLQRVADDVLHRHARVERGERVLEHQPDLAVEAAQARACRGPSTSTSRPSRSR